MMAKVLDTSAPDLYGGPAGAAMDALANRWEATAQGPTTCPYTLEQILDPAWLPANLHGIDDRPATTAK